MDEVTQQQHKRTRGEVPSLDDDVPQQEDAAQRRHQELIDLIMGNNKAIGTVGEAVKTLTQKVEALDVKVIGLERRVNFVEGQYSDQRTVTDNIIKENSELKERMQVMERKQDKLEQKLDIEVSKREALETNGRLINLEISGIPKADDEDCKQLVGKVMALAGCETPLSAVDVAHRKFNGEMIVKFKSREDRNEVYDHRFNLKGKTSKNLGFSASNLLFINENLTIERGQLMHDVRAYMKDINEGKGKDDSFRIKTTKGIVKVMNKYRNYIPVNNMSVVERIHPK